MRNKLLAALAAIGVIAGGTYAVEPSVFASRGSGNVVPAEAGEGGGAQACAHTFGPAEESSINAAMAAGTTVCLTAGTYGSQLVLSTALASNGTLEAKETSAGHYAIVKMGGLSVTGKNLTVNQIHFTKAIDPNKATHLVFEFDEVALSSPGEDGFYCTNCEFVKVAHSLFKGAENNDSGGDGDVLHSQEKVEELEFVNDELEENYDIHQEEPVKAGHMDCYQEEGNPTFPKAGKVIFKEDYLHDNNCQGPFFEQENALENGPIELLNTIDVRNNPTSCEGTGKTCDTGERATFFVNDEYSKVTLERDVFQEDTSNIIQKDNHEVVGKGNVFEVLNNTGTGTTVSENNIFTGNNQYSWPKGTGDEGPKATPTFKCGKTAAECKTSEHKDDFRLASGKTSTTGVNWSPTERVYGPRN